MKENNSKGVTLVSLIITIIVLLILAGVAITNIMGNNNAIDKAEEVKHTEEEQSKKDVLEQALIKYNAGNYIGDDDLENFLKEELNITNIVYKNGTYIIKNYMEEEVHLVSDDGFWKIE